MSKVAVEARRFVRVDLGVVFVTRDAREILEDLRRDPTEFRISLEPKHGRELADGIAAALAEIERNTS